jgi:hypothetical protein
MGNREQKEVAAAPLQEGCSVCAATVHHELANRLKRFASTGRRFSRPFRGCGLFCIKPAG